MRTASFQNSKHILFFFLSFCLLLLLYFGYFPLLCLGVRWSQHGNRPPHLCPWYGFCLSFSRSGFFFPPLTLFSFILQVLGQLHGGCPRWFHERQPPQWHAHHYPPQEVHGTHTHHLSPGQKAQTGLPPTHGRGRGVSQPAGGSRTSWGAVPRVGRRFGLSCPENIPNQRMVMDCQC